MTSLSDYLKDTKSEMKHVSWPTKAQTTSFTTMVIGISVFVGALLGIFDLIYNYLLKVLILG